MTPEAWISLAGLIGTGIIGYLQVKARADHAEWKGELKDWINGSFMRSREAIVRMESSESRQERIEHRLSRIEDRLP